MSRKRTDRRNAKGRGCGPAPNRRVEAALAGALPVERLSDEEGVAFEAEVQSRVEERLRATDLGAVLAARGITTVALNEQGVLTEYRPDGARTRA
jgi:hypothetical protein